MGTEWGPEDARPGAVDAVLAALARIDAAEADVRAWVVVDRERATRAAKEVDRRPQDGPLCGVPFGVKDVIDVAALPTGCGSRLRQGRIAEADAWLVARLREAGAIPIGKTVTTEFAYFSPGPTRNPHDLRRTPGGSSSGSAAAVAAGMVPFALGTQTAGSVIRPAAFCGVAGFVAARGTVPLTGIAGLSPSLDSAGVLAASVSDLDDVHAVLTRATPAPQNVPAPRLAVWDGTEVGAVSGDMLSALDRAVAALRRRGARTEALGHPKWITELVAAHSTVMAVEAARTLAEEGQRPEQLSRQLNELLTTGRDTSSAEYRTAVGWAAQRRADDLVEWERVDAILAPAALGSAPLGLDATCSPVLSRPWQLLGLPVVTVPGLAGLDGMPLGLQLIGHPHRVRPLFAVARWMETVLRDAHIRLV